LYVLLKNLHFVITSFLPSTLLPWSVSYKILSFYLDFTLIICLRGVNSPYYIHERCNNVSSQWKLCIWLFPAQLPCNVHTRSYIYAPVVSTERLIQPWRFTFIAKHL